MNKILVISNHINGFDEVLFQLKPEEMEYKIDFVATKKSFNRLLKTQTYNCVILDDQFIDKSDDSESITREIKGFSEYLPIITLTQDNKLAKVFKILDAGGDIFIEVPLNREKLKNALQFLENNRKITVGLKFFNEEFSKTISLVGNSKITAKLRESVEKIVRNDLPAMISGPIGTEKVEIAKLIHHSSSRSKQPLEIFKCNHSDPEQLRVSLFGRLQSNKTNELGSLEKARRGTLILCEFYLLPLSLQKELYEIINNKSKFSELNVRIISTSSERPLDLVKRKRAFTMLVSRLREQEVMVPDLLQRKEDVRDMAKKIVDDCAKLYGLPSLPFSEEASVAMQTYDWPGNLVQLKNVIESSYLKGIKENAIELSSKILSPEVFLNNTANINPSINHDIMSLDLRNARAIFEKQFIIAQIQRFGGNISHTAAFIGMERTALHRKLSMLGIDSDSVRSEIKGYERKKTATK